MSGIEGSLRDCIGGLGFMGNIHMRIKRSITVHRIFFDRITGSKNKRWLKAKAKSSLTIYPRFIIILLSCRKRELRVINRKNFERLQRNYKL